jgi:hypothetical protein
MVVLYDEFDEYGVVECDECEEVEDEFEGKTFQEFWAAAKAAGWRAYKIGGKWRHSCPSCVAKFRMDKNGQTRMEI